LSLPVTHLSVYILKLEEGTVFYKRQDKLGLPDEDASADMYLFTCAYLKENGMRHYEISNFCFGGNTGKHNLSYWKCKEYLGVGPAAHSFINGSRFYSERDLSGFISGEPCVYDGAGGNEAEKLMLALRTDEGAALNNIGASVYEKIGELQNYGLLTFENNRIILTDRGFLLSNYVISELLSEM